MNVLTFVYSWFMNYVLTGNIGTDIIDGLASLLSSIGTLFVNIFTAAASIFYTAGALTTVGWLMLIGLAIALFMFGLRFIRGLINKARAR